MPARYLSEPFFSDLRQRIAQNQLPVSTAYAKLLEAAGAGMQLAPLSVRDNGNSPHFRVDGVYVAGKDGVQDTAANGKSRDLADRLGRSTLDLALAWRLTGNPAYAAKALELIHTWCINQNTRMFPTGRVEDAFTPGGNYGGDVVMFIVFWKLFLAIYLLNDFPGWDLHAHAAVRRWVKAMIDPQRELMFFEGREMYNNWEDERLLYLAHGALAIDDLDLLACTFNRWQQILPMKMSAEGELPRETMRTRSMTYTLMALHGTITVAEIAHHFGIDLYDYEVNKKSLKLAIDYAAKHLLNMQSWPHQMIRPLAEEFAKHSSHLGLFELAYQHWGDQRYLEIIEKFGHRPIADHATLLYAAPPA